MYSIRSGLDSYIYWGVFIFVAGFMGYFLVSMMSLASAEDEESNRASTYGYIPRSYLGDPVAATSAARLIEEGY